MTQITRCPGVIMEFHYLDLYRPSQTLLPPCKQCQLQTARGESHRGCQLSRHGRRAGGRNGVRMTTPTQAQHLRQIARMTGLAFLQGEQA